MMNAQAQKGGCFRVELWPDFSWETLLVYRDAANVVARWMRAIDANDALNEILYDALHQLAEVLNSLHLPMIEQAGVHGSTWQFRAGEEIRIGGTAPYSGTGFSDMLLRFIPQAIGNLHLHLADGNAPLPDPEKANALAELMNFHIWLQNASLGKVGPLTPMQELHRMDFPRRDLG